VTAIPDAKQQMSKYRPLGVVDIVQKPFNLDSLIGQIREISG
jgi:hypothetical protein